MERITKTVALALAAVIVVVLTAGCPSTTNSKPCTTQAFPLTLDPSVGANADPCVYQTVTLSNVPNCILVTLSADSTGGTRVPDLSNVTFEWNLVTSDRSPTPTASGWTANTNAIGCSAPLGCAHGDYHFRIRNPNGYNCADFGSVTLNIGLQ